MTKTYKIKPLEWIVEFDEHRAYTPFGRYYVRDGIWEYCFDGGWDEGDMACDSIEDGIAAAEANWEGRLLELLEEIKS